MNINFKCENVVLTFIAMVTQVNIKRFTAYVPQNYWTVSQKQRETHRIDHLLKRLSLFLWGNIGDVARRLTLEVKGHHVSYTDAKGFDKAAESDAAEWEQVGSAHSSTCPSFMNN